MFCCIPNAFAWNNQAVFNFDCIADEPFFALTRLAGSDERPEVRNTDAPGNLPCYYDTSHNT